METGSELSKTVATFVIQKILLDDVQKLAAYYKNCKFLAGSFSVPKRRFARKHAFLVSRAKKNFREVGLTYICATAERFYAVSTVRQRFFAF